MTFSEVSAEYRALFESFGFNIEMLPNDQFCILLDKYEIYCSTIGSKMRCFKEYQNKDKDSVYFSTINHIGLQRISVTEILDDQSISDKIKEFIIFNLNIFE